MLYKIFYIGAIFTLLISCASKADDTSGKGVSMMNDLTACLDSTNFRNASVVKGKTADCALNFYNTINRSIPDTDRFKPVGLNMARKMFIVFSDFDNGKVTDRNIIKKEILKIFDESKIEADEVATMVATERAAQSERRRRMFIEAQNFMRSTTPGYGSTVKTCTPSPGAPTGTLVCN